MVALKEKTDAEEESKFSNSDKENFSIKLNQLKNIKTSIICKKKLIKIREFEAKIMQIFEHSLRKGINSVQPDKIEKMKKKIHGKLIFTLLFVNICNHKNTVFCIN